jgi:hypothetical protein
MKLLPDSRKADDPIGFLLGRHATDEGRTSREARRDNRKPERPSVRYPWSLPVPSAVVPYLERHLDQRLPRSLMMLRWISLVPDKTLPAWRNR